MAIVHNTKTKERATRADIFNRLNRLVGPAAETVIQQIVAQLDNSDLETALVTLETFDAQIGSFSLRDVQGRKLIGIYRPMWYVEFYLRHPQPRHIGRAIIDAACSLVEFLLERMVLWGIFRVVDVRPSPMGVLEQIPYGFTA